MNLRLLYVYRKRYEVGRSVKESKFDQNREVDTKQTHIVNQLRVFPPR